MRDEYMSEDSGKPFYIDILDWVDYRKTGNCYESAYITLGTLFANGYKKAIKASPQVEVVAFNKKTKQAITKKTFPLDHTCVLTSRDNPKRKDVDDLVVIDSWLNRAMSVADAKQEYVKFISKKELATNFYEVQEILKRKLAWVRQGGSMVPNKNFNINDYEFKYKIHFVCDQRFSPEEIEEFQKEVSKNYPRLKLDTIA